MRSLEPSGKGYSRGQEEVDHCRAAGRDFHNFNTYYRDNADYEVVAFTAAQIPDIEGRKSAGPGRRALSRRNPVFAEARLAELITRERGR